MIRLVVFEGAPEHLNFTKNIAVASGRVTVPPEVSSQDTVSRPAFVLIVPKFPTDRPDKPNCSTLRNVTTPVFQWKENWKVRMSVKLLTRTGTSTSVPGRPLAEPTVKVTGSPTAPAPLSTSANFFGEPASPAGGVHELFTSPSLRATKSCPAKLDDTLG